MEIRDKMQMVLDVVDGRVHPSALATILPKEDEVEENFIKLAVDFLVSRERERTGEAGNEFKLKATETIEIHEGETVEKKETLVHESEWYPERSAISVPTKTAALRQQFPKAAIQVERRYEH